MGRPGWCVAVWMLFFCLGCIGGEAQGEASPILGARMPALSPDGTQLAFVYRGDIWVVPSAGGTARAITRHPAQDSWPAWSPDGRLISFASVRNGNWDLYAAPVDGGEVRQLTWNVGTEMWHTWMPDGRSILFVSTRESGRPALWRMQLDNGRLHLLLEETAPIMMPAVSPDGRTMWYVRSTLHWTRPRASGPGAAVLVSMGVDGTNVERRNTAGPAHLWPCFSSDGRRVYTVGASEITPTVGRLGQASPRWQDTPARTPNLWSRASNGTDMRQLTRFVGGAVRCVSVAARNGLIAFEHEYDLYVMRPTDRDPRKVRITLFDDDSRPANGYRTQTSGATALWADPNGSRALLTLNDSLWLVQTARPEGPAGRVAEVARQVSDGAALERQADVLPDGSAAILLSDREGRIGVWKQPLAGGSPTPLWTGDTDAEGLTLSRDGMHAAFWVTGARGGLVVLNLSDLTTVRLLDAPGAHAWGRGGGEIAWSPDGRWLAWTREAYGGRVLEIAPIDKSVDPVVVTQRGALASCPAWSPDGKYLLFATDRPASGLAMLPLDLTPPKGKPLRLDGAEMQARIQMLSPQRPDGAIWAGPNGLTLYLAEGDLWQGPPGGPPRRLTSSGGLKAFAPVTGGALALTRTGALIRVGLQPTVTALPFRADVRTDPQRDRLNAFRRYSELFRRGFYDAAMHGRNWQSLCNRYEPLLSAVETEVEFATLLNALSGELDASHCEVTPASSVGTPSWNLGFVPDGRHVGDGIRVAMLTSVSPAGLRVGDVVTHINGESAILAEALYRQMAEWGGRELEWTISAPGSDARPLRTRLVPDAAWRSAVRQAQIDAARARCDTQSKGRVGYVLVDSLSRDQFSALQREIQIASAGRAGLILDLRACQGGAMADELVTWLSRQPHALYQFRDGAVESAPEGLAGLPVVLLIGPRTASNAEILASALQRAAASAPRIAGLPACLLVGEPTSGQCLWSSDQTLPDGTRVRLPMMGVWAPDGSSLEGRGVQPDVNVIQTGQDLSANQDPPLQRAIQILSGAVAQ